MIIAAMRLEKLLPSRFKSPGYVRCDCRAEKHHRSGIAVSRALQWARAMFRDDLLVRSPNGFELTLRGRKILDDLEGLLPRIENLVAPALFDPMREKSHSAIVWIPRRMLIPMSRTGGAILTYAL
jgi:hypothetical protein